jgi:hypothetical protein
MYSVPLIGILFIIIGLSFSKAISLFTYPQKKRQSVNDFHDSHISIKINPFSKLDDIDNSQQRPTVLSLDDDEELISVSTFCENNSIELRLDQDLEFEPDN